MARGLSEAESKKVFSFKDPARTFGFVKPALIEFEEMRERLIGVWGQDGWQFLTGDAILGQLFPKGGETGMTFDHYVFLDKNKASTDPVNATSLIDLGDRCLLRARHDKKKARQDYMQQAVAQERKHTFLSDLHLEPDYTRAFLPEPDWFAIDVSFRLTSPWYSKDDRPLHVLVNPVRKDRVFGVPFMSAASWKGLLRWA